MTAHDNDDKALHGPQVDISLYLEGVINPPQIKRKIHSPNWLSTRKNRLVSFQLSTSPAVSIPSSVSRLFSTNTGIGISPPPFIWRYSS